MLAIVGAIFLAIVGFIWYPVKRFLRGRRQANEEQAAEDAAREK